MISLLEKEARDPVEVLRVKLKDSTETSLLNSQLLREIKNDYLMKQDLNKGQLDGFVQAHVDDIERASVLLELEAPVTEIVENLNTLSQNCRKMNEELGDKKLSSGISIARRNLKELENQIVFYDELPNKARTVVWTRLVGTFGLTVDSSLYCGQLQELNSILDAQHFEIGPVYSRWQPIDEWRQKMLQELKLAATDKMDELGNSKAQARILVSMASRIDAIESVHGRIMVEVWGCMHHCVEVAQFNKKRLADAFEVLEMMEKRRRKFADSKKEYLDNQLKPVAGYQIPCQEKCKTEITTYLSRSVEDMFRFVEKEAEEKNQKPLSAILNAANHLLMNLEIVQSDVVGCFPSEIDVINLFTSAYNTQLESEITKICAKPDIGIAERLQLVQWIEYYNSEIIKHKRARTSGVLEQISQKLMGQYLEQIREQIHTWVTNIWKRDEERVIGPNGELQSTRPNDIVNILKSQISIGQEWLTGRLVGRVVVACLQTLMGELKIRYESFALRLEEIDIESLCSFINETDILQAKCPELVEEISFAETDSEEKEAFDAFMGDGLDTTSTEIVRYAVDTCNLLVDKLFRDVEQDTARLWLTKKWDEGEPVVENLLATLDDYFVDLKHWIYGSFFFSKVVRQCLDECAKEYAKRLMLRTHCFASPTSSASIVENDYKNFVTFFNKYAAELRRTGIRSVNDIEREFESLQLVSETLRGSEPSELLESPQRRTVDQVMKLMKSTSSQETVAGGDKKSKDKKAKDAKKKASKDKEKEKFDKKDKDSKKAKGAAAMALSPSSAKESTPRETIFPPSSADNDGFEVQKLNMADFLGS